MTNLQIYLVASPQDLQKAARFSQNLACAAYRIGQNSALLRDASLSNLTGSLLFLNDLDAPPVTDAEKLAQAVVLECRRRKYRGAVLDFEAAPTPDRLRFVKAIASLFSASGLSLYVPESCAVPGSIPLVNTSVSGGSFSDHLQNSMGRGAGALDAQRLCMDFSLPAPSGMGRPFRPEQLAAMLHQWNPPVYFSQDLCAKYFTFTNCGQTHLILYDDQDTLRQKLHTGSSFGFRAAFLMYPEIADLPPTFLQAL